MIVGEGTVLIVVEDALLRDVVALACNRVGCMIAGVGDHGDWATHHRNRADLVVASATLADGPIEMFVPALVDGATAVMVVNDTRDEDRAIALLGGGVSACISADAGLEELAQAIKEVLGGGVVLQPGTARSIIDQWRQLRRGGGGSLGLLNRRGLPRAGLTPRESDVLAAMADGLSTKAIARRLGVAPKTIENHKIRVFEKLGVRNQAQAVTEAMSQGLLVTPSETSYDHERLPGRSAPALA